MGFQKILVAIDNSQLTQLVFNKALELAPASRGLWHCSILVVQAENHSPATQLQPESAVEVV